MLDDLQLTEPNGFRLLNLTERMRDHHKGPAVTEPIILQDVVTAVLNTMTVRLSATEAKLLNEIASLGQIIDQAKADVAGVSLDSIRGSHIPIATGELGAIVEHTALATDSILESCEVLDRLSTSLDRAHAAILQNAITQIYEACSFQDITGQRITKVVKALQAIEGKVLELAGGESTDIVLHPDVSGKPDSLLNGPGLPAEAMDQDDIDKLLGDF
jgi:chemotaxis protein CheZ